MNVYAIFGHGCDIITPAITQGGDTLIVPPGCLYVTLTFCGFVSFDIVKLMIAFRDPFIADALKDPITHIGSLNQYFETASGTQNDIHIHREGDTYVDSINNFILDTPVNDKTRLFKSGIYTLGNIPETRNPGILNSTFLKDTVRFTRPMIEDAYKGSTIQPTDLRDEYENINEFDTIHKDQLRRQLSVLMGEKPGIYYNFACRTVCDPRHQGLARQRRVLSARGKASPGTAESGSTQLSKKPLVYLDPWILPKPYYAYYLDLKIKELRQKNLKEKHSKKIISAYKIIKLNRISSKSRGPKGSRTGRTIGSKTARKTRRPSRNTTMTNAP